MKRCERAWRFGVLGRFAPAVFLLAIVLCAGCRRTDVRDYTLTLPGLTEANRAQVVEALSKYAGVQKDSYRFDFAKKTFSLMYDSMQIARTNIRMAIQEKGLEVK